MGDCGDSLILPRLRFFVSNFSIKTFSAGATFERFFDEIPLPKMRLSFFILLSAVCAVLVVLVVEIEIEVDTYVQRYRQRNGDRGKGKPYSPFITLSMKK